MGRTKVIILLILGIIILSFSACGGSGSGSGSNNAVSGIIPQTIYYVLTYTAVPVNTTELYVNGVKVSNGEQFNSNYPAGAVLELTFKDTCVYNLKQYQADTFRINHFNEVGTPQPVQPGGVQITMIKDTSVLITYTAIPSNP